MSFGLFKWDSQVNDTIQEAIHHAILFAAASNGGGNGHRTFPATHHGVLCIHASDGHGNDSGGMNPSTESFRESWTTLGVAIPLKIRVFVNRERRKLLRLPLEPLPMFLTILTTCESRPSYLNRNIATYAR